MAFDGYAELCESDDIDVVYIATPHPFHVSHALIALEAGKHVLVEKPVAMNASGAELLFDRAAHLGLFCMEAMWVRFLPHLAFVRAMLKEHAIGNVRGMAIDVSRSLAPSPESRLLDPALGGGALLDMGVYATSIAVDLLGPGAVAAAKARWRENSVDAATSFLSVHSGEVMCTASVSADGVGSNQVVIAGDRGSLVVGPRWNMPSDVVVRDAEDRELRRFDSRPAGRGMWLQSLAVQDAIQRGLKQHPLMPWSQSLQSLILLDNVRRIIGLTYEGESPFGCR
ncbi:putative dehydrogenase [Microbacterium sp. SLBN-154]|nr:putative dehydrogenase [Microbacterium sp. SLBN-154]